MSLTNRSWSNDSPPPIDAAYLNELDNEVRRQETEDTSLQTQIDNLTSGGGSTYNPSAVDAKDAAAYAKVGFIYHAKPLIHPENYYTETAIDNEILVSPLPLYDGSKVEDRGTSNITMTTPKDAFSSGANDELLASGTTLAVAKNRADLVITGDTDTIYQCISTSAGTDLTNTSHYRVRTDLAIRNIVLIPVSNLSTFTVLRGWREFTATESYTKDDLVNDYTEFAINTDGTVAFEGANYFFVEVRGVRTNGGRYYFPYNTLGYYADTSGNSWESTSFTSTTLYGCFQNVGTVSGRDDSILINREYIEGINGSGCNFLPKANRGSQLEELEYLDNHYKNDGNVCSFGTEIIYCKSLSSVDLYNDGGTDNRITYNTSDWQDTNGIVAVGDKVQIQSSGRNVIGIVNNTNTGGLNTTINYDVILVTETSGWIFGTSANIAFTRQSNQITYGDQTYLDIIGSPSNWDTNWLAWIASGKAIQGNALLVGQDGTDYTTGSITPIFSKKFISFLSNQYQNVGTDVWTNSNVDESDKINNTWTTFNVSTGADLVLIGYTAKNTIPQINPQGAKYTSKYATASNSHSLYKGANITNSLDVVATGNGSNGYESVSLENVIVDSHDELVINESQTITQGKIYYIDPDKFPNSGLLEDSQSGYYEWIQATTTDTPLVTWNFDTLDGRNYWTPTDMNIGTTPSHNTINLDNSDSFASKWFSAIGDDYFQFFIQEMVWDYDADSLTDTITSLTAGASWNVTKGQLYQISGTTLGAKWDGVIFQATITDADINTATSQIGTTPDGVLYEVELSNAFGVKWDGNGFGDTDSFDQLTNGRDTDLRGNTIKTKVVGVKIT